MWYLCVFFHRLLDYRKAEVESLAQLFSNEDQEYQCLQWRLPLLHHPDSPFHFVDLPSEDVAKSIASRSILVKGMYELWGEGGSYEELEECIRNYPDERKLPYLDSSSTFKINVDTFGKVISLQEQTQRIQGLSYIPFKGRVNLKNPEHKFWLMETDDYGASNGLPPMVQKRIFFGREIGGADRKLLPTYQLKSRIYLGPTAMDAEMAFLMANQALATPGKLVYDPFVGTGSILIAAAHFGAMTMGADIDIRVVRDGRGPDCNVWSNFKQYGLPMPIALLRADNNLPPWRTGLKEVFDAIICDPPYGVRAGGRKSGGRKLMKGVIGPYVVPDDKRTDHIPSTASYSLVECVHDLLDLAGRMLVMGGRLVFFYPVLSEDDNVDNHFPEHPCFKLIATSEYLRCTAFDLPAFKFQWGQNLELMHDCVLTYPDRVQSLYFTFLFVLRAVTKAADYLEQAEYDTGNHEQDLKTQSLMRQLLYNPKLQAACPLPAKLWKGQSGSQLKQQIQNQFRNISALMDCVGCEKCRLWGKLQVLGLSTALKILFSVDGQNHPNQPL